MSVHRERQSSQRLGLEAISTLPLFYYYFLLYFSAHIINIWNTLPNHDVDVNSVNLLKARLDRFWMNHDVKYDFTADLTGTGDRSVNVITAT